ncbi:hypothetical protein [Dyella sp. SG609]|uniref:cupin domain-containing protein n=1 Tax=Dyella sp. SG609 TaxID=2587018 RepID=UPI0014462E85|nr:hypothetical protein [Dyella sp. SG609]NKJ20492.1 quercetin dioxygenase-like cupin family protein [Dyella sp. SG609]
MPRNLRLAALALAALAATPCVAQHDHRSMVPNGCQPLGTHKVGDTGCYIVAQESMADPPAGPLYWHLDTFADARAARTARGRNGSVIEAFGQVWLLTIAEESWRPEGGRHVATIGPFTPPTDGVQTATYMVATTDATMDSLPHSHPGPEVFYVVEGAQCLETPDGTQTLQAGEGSAVAAGVPMKLYGAGDTTRRALVLVLHDAAQPAVMRNPPWKPKDLCLAQGGKTPGGAISQPEYQSAR